MTVAICISSGHGKHVQGASGIINEVNEARRVVDALAVELRNRGVDVMTFHDNTSTSQSTNLNTIVNWHNSKSRDLDISVHFNAFEQTDGPRGTEVLYLTQQKLAANLSLSMSDAAGFINRGAKKRTDLKFLNSTAMPAVLLEVCFVDSETDCGLYDEGFEAIVDALSFVLSGREGDGETAPELPETASLPAEALTFSKFKSVSTIPPCTATLPARSITTACVAR